jgi:hypothetical protein
MEENPVLEPEAILDIMDAFVWTLLIHSDCSLFLPSLARWPTSALPETDSPTLCASRVLCAA